MYVDVERYDETPMRVTINGDNAAQNKADHDSLELASVSEGVLRMIMALTACEKNSAMVTKLLQTAQSCAMYVRVQGKPVFLFLTTTCPLQAMESTAAVCIKRAVLRNCAVSPSSQQFGHRCRAVCSDQAASNILLEKSVSVDRGDAWSTLHYPCGIHITATCHTKTYSELMGSTVTNLIQASLSLQLSAVMNLFRKCLRS
eukprot:431012-Pyramimonas_sp.AAC.1